MVDLLLEPEPPRPLRTERLELRAFTRDELEAVAGGRRSPGFADGFPSAENVDWARGVIAAGEHFFTESEHTLLAMVERSSGQLVGIAGFVGPPMEGALEVEGSVVPSRQGLGLATEALRALVERAFEDPDIEAVHASVPEDRAAARRVLLHCGFAPVPSPGSEDVYRLPRP
ncbi:GNAT family N-acetyltransferase [Kocuria sp.]|uniref:GNAT family N-acetyltransferase n=1 Tax=Kocuria sp. TaxID=1871328 RepID=UPI0026DD9D1A|nr:GNAT family N-acetyltransferase [Kocuria sp.]MDO4918112.1 GNAT family N-acetyltransferase [Kocuria sp.]